MKLKVTQEIKEPENTEESLAEAESLKIAFDMEEKYVIKNLNEDPQAYKSYAKMMGENK